MFRFSSVLVSFAFADLFLFVLYILYSEDTFLKFSSRI